MRKGIQDERSLVRILWRRGFAVLRAPASGGSTKMPRPDIIAGNQNLGLHFGIEVKTTHKDTLYIDKKAVMRLIEFSNIFGCRPTFALKFKGRPGSWIFITPGNLTTTPAMNYKISFKDACRIGIDLDTLTSTGLI